MLQRLVQSVDHGAELLDARTTIALRAVERLGLQLAAGFALAVLMLCGLLALLAALCISLVESLGIAGALAATGGLIVSIALVAGLFVSRRFRVGRESNDALRERAERSSRALREALGLIPDEKPDDQHHGLSSTLSRLEALVARPDLVGGAAFALVSVLGPTRSLRWLTRGIAAAGTAFTLSQTLAEVADVVRSTERGASTPCDSERTAETRNGHPS